MPQPHVPVGRASMCQSDRRRGGRAGARPTRLAPRRGARAMTGLRGELVSDHASPLVTVGPADAGGQNVHVAALAMQLAALGCTVTVVTRADATSLPRRVEMAPRVQVEHLTAGPPRSRERAS